MNVSKYVSFEKTTGSVFIHAWDKLPVNPFGAAILKKKKSLYFFRADTLRMHLQIKLISKYG